MKNFKAHIALLAVLVAASLSFSVEAGSWSNAKAVILRGEQPLQVPLWDHDNPRVTIDSSERDTANIYLNILDLSMYSYTDTVGTVWMTCDDSAGTDSTAGRLIWEGNPLSNGKAKWEAIDSVAIAAASGAETQTNKVVVNSKRYHALRFMLQNQLAPDAAKKSTCYNIFLNMHRRNSLRGDQR